MRYGATPLIRMLGPKRRTSGITPFAPSVGGGVPWPYPPGPEARFARSGVRLIRRSAAADMLVMLWTVRQQLRTADAVTWR